ncbi:uncharacterized protein K452DRAFT_272103 [Neofusicoccum parvum]|nr:uncharacterized protein K452DRAFT_272103 [Neofusicoccum parvum]
MVKVFFLGGTGHIGGEVINAIVKRFPGIEITTLVRDDKKGARLTEKFSTIKTIIGDLESFDVIEKASRDAGIVINCAPDIPHAPTTHAITRGLSSSSSSSSSPSSPPTFLIHTSGAGLTWTAPTGTHDPSPSAIWSDTASIPAILSAPRTALHAPEDAAVRAAHPSVRVAIVSPTAVYGLSASPVHPAPITLPDTVRAMRALGAGFTVARGDNLHGWVHVADLARIYVGLLADAVAARTSGGGGGPGREPDRRLWGPEAYFFAVGEELAFREWMAVLVPEGMDGLGDVVRFSAAILHFLLSNF